MGENDILEDWSNIMWSESNIVVVVYLLRLQYLFASYRVL